MKEKVAWRNYFMQIAELVATRSTCLRRSVGAVLVKDKRILATGYNGVPSKITHCQDTGCLREKMNIPSGERYEICRGLHAEQNVIIQAAIHGVSTLGATVYCTHFPCLTCIKMLINAGIRKVYYLHEYPNDIGIEMLKETDIVCIQLK